MDLCAVWPQKGQPISYELFTVTQQSQEHVCLASEDLLEVHRYLLESTKVGQHQPEHHPACKPEPSAPAGPLGAGGEALLRPHLAKPRQVHQQHL